MDNISELVCSDKYIQINDELKAQGYKKVALNLSEIDDNESISLDYAEGSFSYKLPYTINIENTKKQLKNEIFKDSHDKLELNNITINANGLITGKNFKTYETALYGFMDVLKKLRRNI